LQTLIGWTFTGELTDSGKDLGQCEKKQKTI